MARRSSSEAHIPGPFLPAGAGFPTLRILAACLLLAAPAVNAQSDAQPGDLGDGTWPGDEVQWEPGEGGDDQSPDDAYEAGYQAGVQAGQANADDEDADAAVNAGPTIDEFQEALTPYGSWVTLPTYGFVWQPTGLGASWRPYSQGQWVWTAYGWTWLADEPWGWAPFHYGRWIWADAGWYWAPGRVWGPAWVSWRWGGGVAGWCPLGWGGRGYGHGPAWVFVESNHFLDPVRRYAVPPAQAQDYYQRARALPHARPGPRAGPRIGVVGHDTGRTINPVPTTDTGHPLSATTGRVFNGGRIQVYRPHTRPIIWAHPTGPARSGGPGPERQGNTTSPGGTQAPGWGGIPGKVPPHFGGVPVQGILDKHRATGGQGRGGIQSVPGQGEGGGQGPGGRPGGGGGQGPGGRPGGGQGEGSGGGGPKVQPTPPGNQPHPAPPGPATPPKLHRPAPGKEIK